MKNSMERHLTLFHSLEFLNEVDTVPGRKVWIPDIPDNDIYIDHLLSLTLEYKGRYFIEDCLPDLRPKNPSADIRIFSVPKSEHPSKPANKIVLYPQSDTLAASIHRIFHKLDPGSASFPLPDSFIDTFYNGSNITLDVIGNPLITLALLTVL